MVSGGVEGCNTSPSWAVMMHTRIPVWMIEVNFSSRNIEFSSTLTKIPVWAESRSSSPSCGKRVKGWKGGGLW